MTTLKIGELAQAAGVTVDTIRYYERKELIAEPPRTSAGYRKYTLEYVTRLRFIRRAQTLGFSLKEIQELLGLRVDSETVCSDVKQRTAAKVDDIDAKIHALLRMRQTLTDLLGHCDSREPTGECPILAVLQCGWLENCRFPACRNYCFQTEPTLDADDEREWQEKVDA